MSSTGVREGMTMTSPQPRLLDSVNEPKDFRDFSIDELKQLADEVTPPTTA
jgi:hypothetical protein